MAKRTLRIASYNINGINTRLAVLLRWLDEFKPDIACLQELKALTENFPAAEIEAAGYSAVWHGQKSWNGVAILSRVGEPVETRRALPNDPDLGQSRYIEAAVCGLLIGCLYLPNGNPWPGPKFDYKLAWMDRLQDHAQQLLDSGAPALLIGDFNVIPTDQDVYKPERWLKDALFAPEAKAKYAELLAQGWTDAIRTLHPDEHLHFLALLAEQLRARRRHPHRPRAAQPEPGAKAQSRGGRSHPARLGQDQRPRADLGRGGGVTLDQGARTRPAC
jgi:exodeoxyribonuclease-3